MTAGVEFDEDLFVMSGHGTWQKMIYILFGTTFILKVVLFTLALSYSLLMFAQKFLTYLDPKWQGYLLKARPPTQKRPPAKWQSQQLD